MHPIRSSIAVPAMMFAHLTIAGAAEVIISAASSPICSGPIRACSRQRPGRRAGRPLASAVGGWFGTRWLWTGLGALMVVSPLGLLAAGIAWGEWGAADFVDPAVRDQITAASGNIAPPESVPQGLQHLSSIWTAPIPDYAPRFMHHESFGYILSAVVGAGLILLVFSGLSWLMRRARVRRKPRLRAGRSRPWQSNPSSATAAARVGIAARFLDRLADGIAHALAHALDADDFARRDGFLQKLDPRVKLGIFVGFIVVAVVVKSLAVLAGLFLLAVALALASGIAIARLVASGVDRRSRLHRPDRAAGDLPGAGRRRLHAAAPRLAGDAAGRAQRCLPHSGARRRRRPMPFFSFFQRPGRIC